MKEATYQWTEDGIVEYGYVEGEISADEKLCYHCARRIMQGAMFMRFHVDSADPYDLCMPCSRQFIRYITEIPSHHNEINYCCESIV